MARLDWLGQVINWQGGLANFATYNPDGVIGIAAMQKFYVAAQQNWRDSVTPGDVRLSRPILRLDSTRGD